MDHLKNVETITFGDNRKIILIEFLMHKKDIDLYLTCKDDIIQHFKESFIPGLQFQLNNFIYDNYKLYCNIYACKNLFRLISEISLINMNCVNLIDKNYDTFKIFDSMGVYIIMVEGQNKGAK
jgi:hypothetical protein